MMGSMVIGWSLVSKYYKAMYFRYFAIELFLAPDVVKE